MLRQHLNLKTFKKFSHNIFNFLVLNIFFLQFRFFFKTQLYFNRFLGSYEYRRYTFSKIKYKNVKKSGRKLKGGITIEIQPLAYQNIPNIPLQWDLTSGQQADVKTLLLEAGDSILVFGYDIQYGPFGRSGGARMSRHADESWGMSAGVSRVPPSFSGTRSNNFISRALKNKDFESKLSAVLVKRLSK